MKNENESDDQTKQKQHRSELLKSQVSQITEINQELIIFYLLALRNEEGSMTFKN